MSSEHRSMSGIWTYHMSEQIFTCSPNLLSLIGEKGSVWDESNLFTLIEDSVVAQIKEGLESGWASGKPFRFSTLFRNSSTEMLCLELLGEKGPEGGIPLLQGIAHVVPAASHEESTTTTNLKEIDPQLHEQQELLRLLMRNIPKGSVNLFDRDYRYVFAEGMGLASVGLTSEALVGKTLFELFPPDQVEAVIPHYERAFSGETVVFDLDLGAGIFRISAAPLPSDTAKTGRIIVIAQDVTEDRIREKALQDVNALLEKRVAERTLELQEANSELKRSNEELGNFTYSISHDLRSPLRSIVGFGEILRKDFGNDLPEQARRYLDIILENGERFGSLLDALLQYGRTGRHVYQMQELDLERLVRGEMEQISLNHPDRKISFQVAELPKVKGDLLMVNQVISNLLSNAVKYSATRAVSKISVGVTHIEGQAPIFSISDNGVGFNSQFSDKLFRIFDRLHTQTEFAGTGVGLALVDLVVKGHGGRVWAESEPDKGATFYFTLSGDPEQE